MIIQKITQTSCIVLLLSLIVSPVIAGKLYRFPDENGVPTISRSLPPTAAQKGYDILDDQSLRLIEHVEPALTPEQIIEFEERQQLEKEAQRQAEIADQKAKKQAELEKQQARREQQQRTLNDQNLLASFQSEQEFISARDKILNQRQTSLTNSIEKQSQLEKKLLDLQQQAAEQELSGRGVSSNLAKRLSAAQQEIKNNLLSSEQLNQELQQITEQFDQDLVRLRELLQAKNHTTAN